MFTGPWKAKGVLEIPNAIFEVRHAVSRKSEGFIGVIDVYESPEHRAAGITCDDLNSPAVPYIPGEDAIFVAYCAFGLAHPELKPDQPVPEPSQALLAVLRGQGSDGLETESVEEKSWWQKVKSFFNLEG